MKLVEGFHLNTRQLFTLEASRPEELIAKKAADAKNLHSLAF